MAFDELLGQNDIKKRLAENVASGHVGHAYLFNAPKGGGKKTFATEFAKMCMCTAPSEDGSACGKCQACVLNESKTNPDIIRVRPEADKKMIVIDQIRDEIEETSVKAPIFSKKKIYIVEDAEKMNEQAQNALLKTLEEPPEYISIFLLSENVESMLDTIRSRVVRVDLKRNSDSEILKKTEALAKNKEINKALLCAYADGIIGRAVDFIQNDDNASQRSEIIRHLPGLFDRNVDSRVAIQKIIDAKNKKYDFFFFQMTSFLRDAMIMSRVGNKAKIMNPDYREELEKLYREVGYYRLKAAIAAVNECYRKLSLNAIAELAVEDMLLKFSS